MRPITCFLCNRKGEAVPFWAIVVISAATLGCSDPREWNQARASYDPFSSRLIQLSADQNRDGQFDQWTYLDGNRPLRGEADTDGDGRVDRWEYFDANAGLQRVGSSTRNDGVEDTWTYVRAVDGESRVDRSRKRDRHIDRREFFKGDVMMRAEEDSNGDGRVERWDRYDGGVLREAAFDTSFASGRPDRRLLYDAQGKFVAVEEDVERDGTFVRLNGAAAAAAAAGVRR
jgi:hypothetical protein